MRRFNETQEEYNARMSGPTRTALAATPNPQNPYQGGGQAVQSPYLNQYMQQQQNYNVAQWNNDYTSSGGNASPRQADRLKGRQAGIDIFYNDPDMMAQRDRLQDLSKGYSGQELGALRKESKSQLAGNRNAYMSSLAGKTARAGVGGARAAAISAAADRGFNQNAASDERKALLDNAQLIRGGVKDFGDFAMRQKYGLLTSELGEAGLGSNERAANAARDANKGGSKGFIGDILSAFGL